MIPFLIVAVVILVLFLWFEWWGRKPYLHEALDLGELRSFFTLLLDRGQNGSLMFVSPSDSEEQDCFLQFVVYGSPGRHDIRFAHPDASWSSGTFEAVQRRLRELGYTVVIQRTGDSSVPRFAIVNLGQDVDAASRLTTEALNVFGYESPAVDIWFEKVGPGPLRSLPAPSGS